MQQKGLATAGPFSLVVSSARFQRATTQQQGKLVEHQGTEHQSGTGQFGAAEGFVVEEGAQQQSPDRFQQHHQGGVGGGHLAQRMGEQPVAQCGGDQHARHKPAPDAVADSSLGPLLVQQGEQGAEQAGHRQLDAGEPGRGNGLGEVAMDGKLDAEGGGRRQKPEQRERHAPVGTAGEQQQTGDGDGQGEPVVAARLGPKGSPGGQWGHQGRDAHDKGAAAQRIALADGGDPQQQAGAEQCAAAGGAHQLGAGRRRFTQPGEGQQQQGGQ